MVKNPIHLRLEKLTSWQLRLFMLVLCERMAINYAYFCRQSNLSFESSFFNILNLGWESLTVKKAKINFDSQLDKLEALIPEINKESDYLIYLAIDAAEALGEFVHAQLEGDDLYHAIRISQLSVQTIVDLESEQKGELLTDEEMKQNEAIIAEWDIQWEIFRIILEQPELNIEFIKTLRTEIKEVNQSNIGLFLSC